MTQMVSTAAECIEPPHAAEDEAKLERLTNAMRRDGWVGAPIVIVERQDADPLAVTGSHRIEAARAAGIDVPAVLLADLFAEQGASLAGLIDEFQAAGFDEDSAINEATIRALDILPVDVTEHYGLDLH